MTKEKKILFVSRSADYFIYFKSIIEALCRRGFKVIFLYDVKWTEKASSAGILAQFKAENSAFDFAPAILRRDGWRKYLFHTRELLSYRSYLKGDRKNLRKFYHDRWKSYLPKTLQHLFDWRIARAILALPPAGWFLKLFESIAPPDAKIIDDIKKYGPDAVIASPVNLRFSSADLEYLKAAKHLKIPTALPVISWDNLTNKGLFHIFPDRLFVWNEAGKKEAVRQHHVPESSIKIIGAPLFDQWFSRLEPSQTREEFCGKNGLRAASPIILYLGSSVNIARDESWVIEEMRKGLDSFPELKNVQIIIRPHPANNRIYERLNLPSTYVIPKEGSLPSSKAALELFKDSLCFSVCTIGINTSGMLDAIIAGKSGMAFMPEIYKDSQMETRHFQHLFESGAMLGVKTGEEFAGAIKKLLSGHDDRKDKREAFIKNFIRPNGLGKTAGECAVEEIEELVRG